MNNKGYQQKKSMKNKIKINKEYQKLLISNIRKNKNKANKKSLKSFLVSNINDKFYDNIYQPPLSNNYIETDNNLYSNHLFTENNNVNSFNNINLNNFNIINQKKPQIKINPTDIRLIYCIKMLGIAKYYCNFAQKKIDFKEFLSLSNDDMTLMKIPENVQKLIKEFSLDYLCFGKHQYTLDELKSYFSSKKPLNNYSNNIETNRKEKISHSFDFNEEKMPKNKKIINLNNINYMNNNVQKRNITNNYISSNNRNNNYINKNIAGYNMTNKNRRINKSASPSKRNYYINKIHMNNNDIQNNLNIIEPPPSSYNKNINQYSNNINFTTKNERTKSYSKFFNFDENYSPSFGNSNNFNLLNKTNINQILDDNNINYNNFGNNDYNYNSRQLLNKFRLKSNKSSDNLYINNYNENKASNNPKNIYNEIFSDEYNKKIYRNKMGFTPNNNNNFNYNTRRGMIMNNCNNYYFYNNYRENNVKENNKNVNNNLMNINSISSKINEKPIINNDIYRNNSKAKDFFNAYMNKNNNMKINNINSDSHFNTQILSNRLENDICEMNINKNKFLDRLTGPLLNQRKNIIDINKEPYNQFRVKNIITNINQPGLYHNKKRNNFLLNDLISNEGSNYKNINNYDNNIILNNIINYSGMKSANNATNNYINSNSVNLINKQNYKNQNIKNRIPNMQKKSYSDANFKITQFQQYNSYSNNNGNNNIYQNDNIIPITYSDGKKRKYNYPKYTNSLTNYDKNLNNINNNNKRSINLSKPINKSKLKQIQTNLNDLYNESNNFVGSYPNQYNNKTLKTKHSKTQYNFYPININDDENLGNYLEDQNNLNYCMNNNIY